MELLGGSLAAAALMAVSALTIGFSKTAIGGLAVIAVAIFATLLPARESTAAILAVLIVGDVVACWHYRREPDWSLIRRLLPAVLPGLVLGTLFLRSGRRPDAAALDRCRILVLLLLQLWVKARSVEGETSQVHRHPAAAWTAGTAMGFTTMTANAAGAVMTLYLSAAGIDKRRFVGTNAWFFLIVNLVKVPVSIGLGLMHSTDAVRAAVLAPADLVGGLVGYATVRRISQRAFDLAVLLASALAAGVHLLG